MSRSTTLDLKTLSGLASAEGIYFTAFSWLFGQTVWVSFIGGVIAHKALTRQQFSALQAKSFPAYFLTSTALSALLLAVWTVSHPDVIPNIAKPLNADVAQFFVLLGVLVMEASNYVFIGPKTNRVISERQRLEREESKLYNDPSASAAMKAVNKQFGIYHGLSSLLNLFVVFGLGFHSLWIGNYGLRRY